MNDLKELEKLMKEHPIIIVVTLAAMAAAAASMTVAIFFHRATKIRIILKV